MSTINVSGLKQLSGNDEAFVNDILKLYTERTSIDLSELKDARDEINWRKVRFVIHRMRSAAVPLGLKELVILLRKVENKLKAEELEGVLLELDQITKHSEEALQDAKRQLEIA
ncbi:MAG: HPt (histidine-containing phosphotransfer) domain-containing protein [Flammeovirgaceae bacterium]|jgi:HPt (histidine-containing phosphotransfer) domain-containing protein